jgi:hypothetical protein
MRRVLVVSEAAGEGDRICDRLEEAGFDVMRCPGPRAPTYECIASRGCNCPLATGTDCVVLDGELESDAALQGTPSWWLASYYRSHGLPVIALTDPLGTSPLQEQDGVSVVARRADPDLVLAAVRQALGA